MGVVELTLLPAQAANWPQVEQLARSKAGMPAGRVVLLRRSIDARKAPVRVRLRLRVEDPQRPPAGQAWQPAQKAVTRAPEVLIVGSGPAGLFAAMRLLELGYRPVILERGKDVRARRRDLAAINRQGVVNPESNYCFGEGGAGTYSDGKLYTRAKKRGNVQRILEILHYHGAPADILTDAHPHIGTNKLPKVVAAIREYIVAMGGVIQFNCRVTSLLVQDGAIAGVATTTGTYKAPAVILATGHSARDVYEWLHRHHYSLVAKPFALGVRVEHPQALIDSIQYHCPVRDPYLPAAAYSLVTQVDYHRRSTGVFSFCMCPGGFIVPAATAPGEVVVNGMSPSRRNSRFANSGVVVALDDREIGRAYGDSPLRYMYFQQALEQKAFAMGGATLAAPAQRLADFVDKKVSSTLPETSYQPGVQPADMYDLLPANIALRLRQAFKVFGRKMPGYLTNEAVMLGVESRTSAPVRLPRHKHTCEYDGITGLYPCGEGAGYAGGIVSAALDGERCAEWAAQLYRSQGKVR